MNEQTILLIADGPGRVDHLLERWSSEASRGQMTVMTSDAWLFGKAGPFHLAIVVEVVEELRSAVIARCDAMGVPSILLIDMHHRTQEIASLPSGHSHCVVLPIDEESNWFSVLSTLSREILKRVDAVTRAKRAEASAMASMAHIALGQYVMDSMHGFNNALTAVVGNAELLMLDPSAFPPDKLEQIDAIHSNALRLHEMMQRFASIQTEMQFGKKDSRTETKPLAQAYHSGS